MKLDLAIENASSSTKTPDEEDVHRWVTAALDGDRQAAALSIKFVDATESADLNLHYRHKSGATNVLSFPADIPEEIQSQLEFPLLGDLAICTSVVEKEAAEQKKPLIAHWAHMIIHGSLHLIGYDHINDQEAADMEQREIDILGKLGFANPYQTDSPPAHIQQPQQGAENAK